MGPFASIITISMVVFLSGCAVSGGMNKRSASDHSAKLANDACEAEFGERPFSAGSYEVEMIGGRWRWGNMKPGGIRGYSTTVSFLPDGKDPKVEVVLSSGLLRRNPGNPSPFDRDKDAVDPNQGKGGTDNAGAKSSSATKKSEGNYQDFEAE